MPHKRRRRGRKSKFVTKRGLPFQLMKYAETKFTDVGALDITLTNPAVIGPQFLAINALLQGVQQGQRIGNMVQITGVYIRFIFETILTGENQWVRIMLSTPRDPTSTAFPFTGMVSLADPDTDTVWYDRVHNCAFQPGGGNGVVVLRKKWKPYMKTIYNDSVPTSIEKNNLQLSILPQNNVGVIMTYTARVYFKDL